MQTFESPVKLSYLYLLFFLVSGSLHAQMRDQQTHVVYSKSLAENRTIFVSLPKNYDISSEKYSVLYMLDGEYTFDFAVGSVSFLSNAFGHLPPLIIVSIPNVDRGRDMTVRYNATDEYEDFLKFMELELVPFINRSYRVNGFDILYGWSSASNINMQFLAKKPNLFDAHIQTGTGIGTKTTEFLSGNVSQNSYQNAFLYANVEGEGPRVAGLKNYEQLFNQLNPEGLSYKFEIMDSSSHVNVIADGIYRGLQFIYEEYYIPDETVVEGSDQIISYYNDLNKKYGLGSGIPEGAIVESAGLLFQNEKPEESVKLLEYGMELYPWSYDLAGSLGEVYEYLGEKSEAARYYKIAYKKAPANSPDAQKYSYLSKKMSALK